jgi:hypothetical protein
MRSFPLGGYIDVCKKRICMDFTNELAEWGTTRGTIVALTVLENPTWRLY